MNALEIITAIIVTIGVCIYIARVYNPKTHGGLYLEILVFISVVLFWYIVYPICFWADIKKYFRKHLRN